MRTNIRTALLSVVPLASAMTLGALSPAAIAAPTPETAVTGDIEGDLIADLVVGVPNLADGRGAVDFRYTSLPSEVLRHAEVAGVDNAGPGDRFGAAVVTVDVNEDGYSDALIGAPGRGSGHVYLVFGSPQGIRTQGALDLRPDGVEPGDRFGETIGINGHPDGGLNVFVGAPGEDLRGVEDAGQVRQFRLFTTEDGTRFRYLKRINQNMDGIPGANEKGDRFGEVLDASPVGVLVGAPFEDIAGESNAGAVTALRYNASNAVFLVQQLSQAGDAPGRPEAGDRFGSAISSRFGLALIGVPREDVGGESNAGAVAVYENNGKGGLDPSLTLTQGSPHIPGSVEAGDRFGSSVLLGNGTLCNHSVDAAIGSPYENLSGEKNAGTVTLLTLLGEDECHAPHLLRQGEQLPGTAEAGDRVGSELAVKYERADNSEGEPVLFEQMYVGAPGENLSGVKNAGVVQITPRASSPHSTASIIVDGEATGSVTYSNGPREDLRYGRVIGFA